MKPRLSPVCVLGLGFVGLTLSARLSQSRQVYGLEIDSGVREVLSSGKAHFFEPGLDEIIQQAIASDMLILAAEASDIPKTVKDFVITVGTPIRGNEIDLSYIDSAVKEISELVDDETCIILRSTVALGVTRSRIAEVFSGVGKFPRVAMCPERTVEGKALVELSELPQIIGGIDEASFLRAESVFSTLGCPIERVSSPEAAETVKLVTNTFRDITFAFANEIALFSEATNLDAVEIISASNRGYPRSTIPVPGLTGGPCLEKDPWIFAASAEAKGVDLLVTKSARRTHESVIPSTMSQIVSAYQKFPKGPSGIVVAGLAFKGRPATSDVRGSLAGNLRKELGESISDAEVYWFDPLVSESDAKKLGFSDAEGLDEIMAKSRLLLIQNNNEAMLENLNSYFSTHPYWAGQIFDYTGVFPLEVNASQTVIRFGNGVLK